VSFAQASRLQFQSVDAAEGGDGIVEVAIALNVNSSYTGVLEVPARTDTGPQRALKGDEFFFVHSGQVMLELGDSRYHLHAGDHVAIPNMACYSFHNPSGSRCSLVFFVPRNPYG
jgi:mannose-6-phosphate isomerase-like protein (cupin superfamily)